MMQGYIVVITRNGSLGGRYPLTSTECLFGQSPSCDVRVYVANVARKHCLITALPNERAYIRNLSPSNTTLVNGIQIGATQYELQHADVITVGDRHFRWEYPISSRQKTPAKKTMDSQVHKTPTCMVQVPMSVFKKKRHSSPGVLRENKIISITSQDEEEPNPKRRKTLHSVKDLMIEKKLVKPINKQLMAVTQPASSPKSFNTFKVLLKSVSKRKSQIPISKTPNPKKKVISTKVPRSKSLSPLKLSPKQKSFLKHSPNSVKKSEQINKTSKLNVPPLKSAAKKLSIPALSRKSISTLINKTPMKHPPAVNPRLKRHSVATAANKSSTPEKLQSPTSSRNRSPVKSEDSGKTIRGTPSKTPQVPTTRKSASPKALSSPKSPLSKTPSGTQDKDKTPTKTPQGRPSKTAPARNSNSPDKLRSPKNSRSPSPLKAKMSGRQSRGRPSNSPRVSPIKKSEAPSKSPMTKPPRGSTIKYKTPGKTPRGRPSKTSQATPTRKSVLPSKSPMIKTPGDSTVKTPGKTPRGRPKTPQATPTRKSVSPSKSLMTKTPPSGSPVKDKTPGKTPRGRPPKTPQASPTRKSVSPSKSPMTKTPPSGSPVKDKTPGKTPRGRPPKTSQASPTRKSVSPSKSPMIKTSPSGSPVKDKTPGKTPRGRPPKTPQASPTRKSVSPSKSPMTKTPPSGSPVKDKTPGKTPRGRPPKTPQASPTRKSVSPSKFPMTKTPPSGSPVKDKTPGKTPRGRPPKTPQASPTRKSVSLSKSPMTKTPPSGSPMKDKTPGKTPRGRPPKTPQASPIRKSVSPSKSSLSKSQIGTPDKDKTPGKTPRGRPPKTPEASPTRKSVSPSKSSITKTPPSCSPVKDKTPGKTPSGRSPKTPEASPARKSVSPSKSPMSKISLSGAPVTDEMPRKTPRGRPPKTSPIRNSKSPDKLQSPKTSRSPSPFKAEMSGRRSRGRPSKSPKASPKRKSVSPSKSPSLRISRSDSPVEVTPGESPRGWSPKTPRSSSSVMASPDNTPRIQESKGRTSRGRTKTPQALSTKTVSPSKSIATILGSDSGMNTPKTPKLSGDATANMEQKSSISLTPVDQPFGRDTKIGSMDLSVTKSARRSAVKSGLSSSKDLTSSLSKPLLLKSSTKQAEIAKLQIDSKRKYDTSVEAKAERAAKRLKMETPKSLTKNKKAALLVCHSPKSQKRPLFSEVLKSHLSTAKKKQATIAVHSVLNRRAAKQISCKQPLSLEVPKSFKFNSTGHANSPETIIIRKQVKKTPVPKTRKGRKSIHQRDNRTDVDNNLEGVPELFKTPKSIMSSLKTASSMKKSQNVRVRFSLQNDVQSPSGRRSLVMHSDEAVYFGSPMIPSKKYTGTPRPPMRKLSDTSLMHTSIMEESPIAQEIDSSEVCTSASETSAKSYDFSVYSPSSPTLQLSRISGLSSDFARKSIDFNDSVDSKSSKDSSKRKRFSKTANDTQLESSPSTSKRFSFASASSCTTKNSSEEPSPESNDNRIGRFPKRISSTPKLVDDSNLYSPISSPISMLEKRSLRSFGSTTLDNLTEESSKASAITENHAFKSPLSTPGKKPRKGSIRMNASNAGIATPESQVPVAAVKPSTRRKQGHNESYSSASDSVSLPSFSVSHDISERSIDRNFSQKIMDSIANSSRTSRSTSSILDESVLSQNSLSSSRRKRKSSTSTSIQSVDATTFDFTSATTPKIPREMFVSPLDKNSDDLTNISGVKRILSPKGNSPVSSYEQVGGIKKLFKPSNPQNDLTDVVGVKRVMSPKANSPISSYIDVRGVKRLLKTPRSQSPLANYASIEGIKELFKNSPVSDYTNVVGVKNLYSAPVEPNYMNVRGVRRIFKETKVPNSPDLAGVEVLFESPKKLTDELNQLSSYKPVGMVPPMSRDVSGTQGSSSTLDNHIEDDQLLTRNSENTVRRRTLASQRSVDEQSKSNLRKSKRTNSDLQSVSEAAVQSLGSEKKGISKQVLENENIIERINTRGRRTHNKTQVPQLGNEEELHGSKILVEKDVKATRTNRGRPRRLLKMTENKVATEEEKMEEVSLNNQPSIGKRARYAKKDIAETSKVSNDEEINEVKVKKTGIKKETIELSGRETRRTARSPSKQEDTQGFVPESQMPGASENVQSTDNVKRTRRGKINDPVNVDISNEKLDTKSIINMESEPCEGTKRNPHRRGKGNTTQEPTSVKLPANTMNRRLRGKPVKVEVQEVNSKSVKQLPELAETTAKPRRKASPQASTTKLLMSEETNTLGEIDSSCDPGLHSTTSPKQDDSKRTRRRVQFNMKSSSPPSTSSPKKRAKRRANNDEATSSSSAKKTESPVSSPLPKPTAPAKKGVTKTKATPKLKAAIKTESPVPSPSPKSTRSAKKTAIKTKAAPKSKPEAKIESPASRPSPKSTVPAKKVATKTKAAPKLKAAAKVESPVSSPSPARRVPAKKAAAKAKAAPKSKAAAKVQSPVSSPSPARREPAKKVVAKVKAASKSKAAAKAESPVSSPSPKKTVPAKKTATKTKAAPKSKAAAKTESPAPSPSPGSKVPAKKVVIKTKAVPKLKAAAKRKSSTPVKSPPVKRVTRARK